MEEMGNISHVKDLRELNGKSVPLCIDNITP